jgi:DNA repair exonuclease SbcCD ATPase subunit
MDLFHPPIQYNLINKMKEVNFDNMENPYIRVVWEDHAENFTTERIKSVKTYFETKYNSKNVNIITKVKTTSDNNQSADVAINILDDNFQKDLIGKYLTNNGIEKLKEDIFKLDNTVESIISADKSDITPFKKWYINKIEFSNFLSFGDNQTVDFSKVKGINTIESNPPNFGGKTVLSVDLLLFLFFNTTTKTSKSEEIFNRFRNKDKVSVVGDITIDGEDYIIARTIERKLNKSGEWNIKNNLDFFKRLSDGSIQNFTGEQRRETENFIKSSIGTMDDFLMTILTTSSNLEDLIDSKPTARGQVLSRFLGLDSLKLKEETAKDLYSKFSKSMISNIYNTETLKNEIVTEKESIEKYELEIKDQETSLSDVQESINKGIKFRDDLISKKNTNIDEELVKLKPSEIEQEIRLHNDKILELNESIKNINVVEPSEYYHEDKHDVIRREITDNNIQKAQLEITIESLENLKSEVSGGIKCNHCGIDLINAALTVKKLDELNSIKESHNKISEKLTTLVNTEKSFVQLKKNFDEYEKNKLIKEKFVIQLESASIKKSQSEDKLKKYKEYQSILEDNMKIDETLIRADIKLSSLETQKINIVSIIERIKSNIVSSKNKIEKNNDLIIKIAEEFEKERIYKTYLDIFGKNGISKMIMRTMMPVINSELQRLLSDSAKFKLEVQINDKNEVEFIMVDNETQISKLMSSGSGFERTIASLALRSVLSKVCSLPKPNIIVFDEVFGKVSNDNLEMVYEFFVKIKTYFDKILIITHNPMLSQWSDGVIKIEKQENISNVIQ